MIKIFDGAIYSHHIDRKSFDILPFDHPSNYRALFGINLNNGLVIIRFLYFNIMIVGEEHHELPDVDEEEIERLKKWRQSVEKIFD